MWHDNAEEGAISKIPVSEINALEVVGRWSLF